MIIIVIDLLEFLLPSLLGLLVADNWGEEAEAVFGVVLFLDLAQPLETPWFAVSSQRQDFYQVQEGFARTRKASPGSRRQLHN